MCRKRKYKRAFAEIIDEPMVPKDWAGETSDLFSSRVVLDGKRISTAFSVQGAGEISSDDARRSGEEWRSDWAFVLRASRPAYSPHCHEVTPAVRKQMRAYAQQMGNPRRFCIIDGYDTLRILKAYGKCGLTS